MTPITRVSDWRLAPPPYNVSRMPKLVISGTAHELVEDLITVGRAPDNTIILEDPSVSSRHAQFERAGEVYRLKDRQSTNGTRVNGVPITETMLRADDRIRFGAVEARFEPDTRGSQPLPSVEEVEARPAEMSAAPVDFANASPFPDRRKERDRGRTVVLAVTGLALLAFLISIIAVLTMHAPVV
jgi:predicted component of type VI protein secretion system